MSAPLRDFFVERLARHLSTRERERVARERALNAMAADRPEEFRARYAEELEQLGEGAALARHRSGEAA